MGAESESTDAGARTEPQLSLEERVARIEGKLGWRHHRLILTKERALGAFVLLVLGLWCGLVGMGRPNHFYQLALAVLAAVIAYHRDWLIYPRRAAEWVLAVLNTAAFAILFKLVIGSGKRFPLEWLYYPTIGKAAPAEKATLPDLIPQFELSWQPSPMTEWSLDLTIIQTFLLLVTLIGAAIEFQPFASLTALLLVVFSLPALVSFDWPWVFPAILLLSGALYVQSSSYDED